MKQRIKKYAKELITFVVVMTIFTNVVSLYKSGDLNKEPLSIINTTLVDGKKFQYADKKPILIHFWATWCPTCSVEASNIQIISEHYEVLTFAVKSGKSKIDKYMKENSLDFNFVNDESSFIASEFKIAVYPTTFIYDKNREVVFSEVGYTSTWGLWLRMWWAGL